MLCFIVMGCTSLGQDYDKDFSASVPIPIRHFIKITYIGSKPIDTETDIEFVIENITNDCIELTNDPGTFIYVYVNQKWVKIPNKMEYENSVMIDSQESHNRFTGDSINPDYSSIPSSAYLLRMRVIIVGRLCHNGTPQMKTLPIILNLL
ncbi:MAG: hypothetical protein WCE68_08410 [Anaerolineales bacterium]